MQIQVLFKSDNNYRYFTWRRWWYLAEFS